MKGWLALAAMLVATAGALLVPWQVLAAMGVLSFAVMRTRWQFLAFSAITLAFNAVLLAWLYPAPADASVGPIGLSLTGFEQGLVAGARITALLGANLAVMSRYSPARLLDDLRLPRRVQGFLAAVLIAAHDVGRDFQRLRDARRLEGEPKRGRMAQMQAAAGLVPALLVASSEGAVRRREALRLAGLDTGPGFAPIVAVTALAVAGRLALVAVPNVSLTFALVFAGGVAFGARVGFWAGFWSMLLSDIMLSGLFLPAFVNMPTTALLGALGGAWARPQAASHHALGASGGGANVSSVPPGRAADAKAAQARSALAGAAAIGILATLAWSVATDALSWALIAENRQSIDRLRFAVLAGLVFNAVPALVNGFLFAAVVGPVAAAFEPFRTPAGDRPTA